jgi:hypothetical protein
MVLCRSSGDGFMSEQDQPISGGETLAERFHKALKYRGFKTIEQFARMTVTNKSVMYSFLRDCYRDPSGYRQMRIQVAFCLGVTEHSLYAKGGELTWTESQAEWYARWVKTGRMPEDGPTSQPYGVVDPASESLPAYAQRLEKALAPLAEQVLDSLEDHHRLSEGLAVLQSIADTKHPAKSDRTYLTTVADVARIGWCAHCGYERGPEDGGITRNDFDQLYAEFREHEKDGVGRLIAAKPIPPQTLIDNYKSVIKICGNVMHFIDRALLPASQKRPRRQRFVQRAPEPQ